MHITDSEDRVTIVRIPMHVPTESNSVYKKRLITAMLEEPVFRETSRRPPSLIPGWSPTLVAAAIGIALLSGLGVFFLLYHHDASASSSGAAIIVREGNGAVRTSTPGPLPAVHSDAANGIKAATQPASPPVSVNREVSRPASVEFKLKRSRTSQRIGSVGLRLIRVNMKRRTCDLSLQLSDHRVVQKRLLLNKPLQLNPPLSIEPLQLTISGIARDSVAGVLSTLASSSDGPKQGLIQ